MVNRKGGLSGKQKSVLLKQKRAQQADDRRDESAGKGARLPSAAEDVAAAGAPGGRRLMQQVSKKGHANELSTAFVREENKAVAGRRLAASDPMGRGGPPPVALEPSSALGLPSRPAWADRTPAEQAAEEEASFSAWVEEVHARFDDSHLSPFEHNLEVWRQCVPLPARPPKTKQPQRVPPVIHGTTRPPKRTAPAGRRGRKALHATLGIHPSPGGGPGLPSRRAGPHRRASGYFGTTWSKFDPAH